MARINTKYTHRQLARCIIEAKTPIAVGSGESDVLTDSLVVRDVNHLPYIPATSLAGVIRGALASSFSEQDLDRFFGFQNAQSAEGSKVIFSEAKMLDSDGAVIDGLKMLKSPFLKGYTTLPIRQHVRINAKGTTDKSGKFDEQVVYAGTRFCFEVEYLCSSVEDNFLSSLLQVLKTDGFRLGGGTRSGFGEVEVMEMKKVDLDLTKEVDLNQYLNKSSNLSDCFWNTIKPIEIAERNDNNWIKYTLKLSPRDFILFGSGLGDEDADMNPVRESKVSWISGRGEFRENYVLIPASSVKGAISHRVAYYWNKLNNCYAEDNNATVGAQNEAVRILFGYEDQEKKEQKRGNVLFSDVFVSPDSVKSKVLHHVSIDRYTGGAKAGALFQEKVNYMDDNRLQLDLLVKANLFRENDKQGLLKKSLESALKDVCEGLLPLGGGVNRGQGSFYGEMTCDGELV